MTEVNSKPSCITNVKMVTDLIKHACDIGNIETRSRRKHNKI